MNEASMDALNRGWALGFGTNIRHHNADLVHAAARLEATRQASNVRRPTAFEGFAADLAHAAEELIASLNRSLAR